jgi:hypothetical protein
MERYLVRGEAARRHNDDRRRQQQQQKQQGRQVRIEDMRATVVLPSSALHPAPEELLRLARTARDPDASERDASLALRALSAYDVTAEDLRGGAVAAAVRWRRDHGRGHGADAPGGLATRSDELARRLLAKWKARVLEDARRARRAERRRRPIRAAFEAAAGGGGAGVAAAQAAGLGGGSSDCESDGEEEDEDGSEDEGKEEQAQQRQQQQQAEQRRQQQQRRNGAVS